MSDHCVTVGTVVKIFPRQKCIGFIPTCTITKGDVLALELEDPGPNGAKMTFTISSMRVDDVKRDTAEPGERCAVLVDPFPAQYLWIGMPVLRNA